MNFGVNCIKLNIKKRKKKENEKFVFKNDLNRSDFSDLLWRRHKGGIQRRESSGNGQKHRQIRLHIPRKREVRYVQVAPGKV